MINETERVGFTSGLLAAHRKRRPHFVRGVPI